MPNPDNQALEQLGRTDATAPLVVGNQVYDPLCFEPNLIRFTRKQYLFLNNYRLGTPLAEAAEKAGVTAEQAERFLDKADVKAWLADRARMNHIKTEWEEPAKWWFEGNRIFTGEKSDVSKAQIIVWQEFGARVCPKKGETGNGGGTKIEINIDPNAVRNAFIRQEAIETEVAK